MTNLTTVSQSQSSQDGIGILNQLVEAFQKNLTDFEKKAPKLFTDASMSESVGDFFSDMDLGLDISWELYLINGYTKEDFKDTYDWYNNHDEFKATEEEKLRKELLQYAEVLETKITVFEKDVSNLPENDDSIPDELINPINILYDGVNEFLQGYEALEISNYHCPDRCWECDDCQKDRVETVYEKLLSRLNY